NCTYLSHRLCTYLSYRLQLSPVPDLIAIYFINKYIKTRIDRSSLSLLFEKKSVFTDLHASIEERL
ncbi:hypothetical protein, partial [Dubosiella newyorkensis]|uniref:hypothetical protein n=1 Tax=Dubosiella newyorkensis TaxID=1862672 RepID=UPI0023F078A9